MYLYVKSVKTGYLVVLYDSSRREIYANFSILVKSGSISSYLFSNQCLTPSLFHYWCRYVVGLTYLWLKGHSNKGFYVDEDFEFR